ncbi:MAG: hypothetical protein E7591_00805 [Ruminococcaceae bacterium]|nr:hypothetical protein [Oscillospiraceae bacterium]
MKYALRRKLTYNKVVLWALDDEHNFKEVRYGYINSRNRTITVYKDHKKVDTFADVFLVPLRNVKGLKDSYIRALMADGCITPAEGEKMAVGT